MTADRSPSTDATPEPWRHRAAMTIYSDSIVRCDACSQRWPCDAEQQRQRADALEMAVWRFDASRNVAEGREERWLAVLTAMGVCPDCRHPHDTTVCYANVGGATPEPCLCDTDPRTFARSALQAASGTTCADSMCRHAPDRHLSSEEGGAHPCLDCVACRGFQGASLDFGKAQSFAVLDNISARVNRGIGEGSLVATRWRDALIDVGAMIDNLINGEV